MLTNFLRITWRNLNRNRLYSIINISGLSIGIACSLLILLWVNDEISFDLFLSKNDRLYQVWANAEFDGKINSWKSVPLPTYEEMKSAHSGIVNTTVSDWGSDHLLTVGETRVLKEGYFVGEEFLQMFEFPLVAGDRETIMADPLSIVITESLANVLFGEEDPMNQLIKVDDKGSLKVTGILRDLPENSSFQFEFLMTWKYRESINEWVVRNKTNWGNYSFQVFVELADPSKEPEVEAGVSQMLIEHGEDDPPSELFLHPLPEWRLHSTFENGRQIGGMNDYVKLFTVIALFILVIACINFINLATARSERRVKEVGIRKSLGSYRYQLILQFIGESVFVSLLAYVLAILLGLLVLSPYNAMVEKDLYIDFASTRFWIFSVGVILLTGVISGSYPAFYLSSFDPVKTLKGSVHSGKQSGLPRKILVTLQFAFSILLMIGTVVIYKQIELVKNRELGYRQDNLITVETTDDLQKNYKVLKQELLQSGIVEAVTRSNSPITDIWSNNFLGWPGKPDELKVLFTTVATEYDFTKTMGINLLMGRDFSEDFSTDTSSILINKAGLDLMGLENPLGTSLDLWGGKRKLIGVVDNVLMGSPDQEIKPMFMVFDPEWISSITIRLKPTADLQGALREVQGLFEKHNSAYPFEYTFVDDEFRKKYTTISMTQQLATLFSLLALFITGLGLFGLASYTAQQRIKEMGIRKVLGASVVSLVSLITRDFTRLVIISFVLAAPIAWYLLNQYLERYQVRIVIPWWIFPLVGLVALGFTLLIVTNQARRAAQVNPASTLRSE